MMTKDLRDALIAVSIHVEIKELEECMSELKELVFSANGISNTSNVSFEDEITSIYA